MEGLGNVEQHVVGVVAGVGFGHLMQNLVGLVSQSAPHVLPLQLLVPAAASIEPLAAALPPH